MGLMKGALIFGAGAATAWFLDPDSGNRRRSVAADKAGSYARKGGEEAARRADYAAGVAKGAVHEAAPTGSGDAAERLNDPALARKVESEIFRDDDVPKGDVLVNVEDGVVHLRGTLDDEAVAERLVTAARAVDGVREVESHLQTAPA
jgi:hyperosmotically inducible periplasmic protein